MTLNEHIQGTSRSYHGGSFYHVERSLGEIDSGTLGDYICDNKDSLLLKSIKRKFSELEHIPKSKMLFFDIETCGFDSESPIISIALAHMHRGADINVECLFARNYAEEKTLLKYFLHLLPKYEAFFSYNGKSFDSPRIKARAIHNGLYTPELKNLGGIFVQDSEDNLSNVKEVLNGNGESRHHDLYHLCRQKKRLALPDAKLKTIEKLLFGFTRSNDLASEDIPQVYFEYVYGRKMETKKIRTDVQLWKECRQRITNEHRNHLPEGDPRLTQYTEVLYDYRNGTVREVPKPGERINEEQRKKDMARLIHHNLVDTVTLTALLCYLCGPHAEQPQISSSEGELPF